MDWPHAPLHKLDQSGTFMVTADTYMKAHIMMADSRKVRFMQHLFNLAQYYSALLEMHSCILGAQNPGL